MVHIPQIPIETLLTSVPDFETLGNTGWNWESLAPHFRRAEGCDTIMFYKL